MERDTSRIYQDIIRRIGSVRKKSNVASLIRGLLVTALCAGGAFLLAVAGEYAFHLDAVLRTIIFWFFSALLSGLFLWCVGRPVLRLLHILPDESDAAVARRIGGRLSHLNDHLENILELYHERSDTRFFSPDLIDASFEDLGKDIEHVNFASILDYSEVRRLGRFLGVLATMAVLLLFLFPDAVTGSFLRLWHYSEAFAAPVSFRFIVEPGSKEVVKGERVPIDVRVIGEAQSKVTLSIRQTDQAVAEEKILVSAGDQMYRYEIPGVKATIYYSVRSGSIGSEQYTLTVVDRPMVKMLRVRLDFPRYCGLPPRQLDDQAGDVMALKGTAMNFSLEGNKPLSETTAMFNDGSSVRFSIDNNKATGTLVLMKERTYHFVLKDMAGTASIDPIEYTMRVIPDAFPTASIPVPGSNVDVPDNATVNMLFKITDDYGFTRLRLGYRLAHSRYEKPAEEYTFVNIPLPSGTRMQALIPYSWPLAKLRLVPEDVVSYFIEVFDNDDVSGPKSSASEVFTLRVPSMDEVIADADKAHGISLEGLKHALQEAQEAKKDLDALQQDLKKDQQKMDWQDQKKGEELIRKYDEIQKKMEEVSRKVDEMVSSMAKNQLLSRETLEKYMELQQMMQQLTTPEFAEAMKRFQQAMQQMNAEAMRQAMQQFNFSEESFRKSIERTMNLLKRIQIEAKVDEMIRRADEMKNKQEDLLTKTEHIDPADKQQQDALARQQRDLQRQLQEAGRELAELQKQMEEFAREMPLSELMKARESLEHSGLEHLLEEVAQQMQQQQLQLAAQGQRNAAKKMGEFHQQLQQVKQALQQNQQRQIVNEMRKALQDLLELSRRQENLKNESRVLEQNSRRFRENAQEQMDVLRDLGTVTERLSGLSQKTFSITPEMGKSIGDAMRGMNEAMQSLEQRNGSMAAGHQASAMASLNESSQQLESSINAMMQGGGEGMGMAGFMQRLQKMSGMQQKINEQTQNLQGLSPEQAAAMARLAGEQGMVRKSLEQLAREASRSGDLSKMLGDLNSIAQEMREVQTDLAQANANPETLRKQDRILSRLLDSQRSVRERDYEKKRKAESGKNPDRGSPAAIDLTTQEGKNQLHRDLLKALEAGYAKDYEELIRKYFEALER